MTISAGLQSKKQCLCRINQLPTICQQSSDNRVLITDKSSGMQNLCQLYNVIREMIHDVNLYKFKGILSNIYDISML